MSHTDAGPGGAPPSIRLLLVDDHGLFRESLGRLLEDDPGLTLVGSAATLPEAYAVLAQSPVDVVLLDFDLGESTGLDFLRREGPWRALARVLIVSGGLSPADAANLLASGAAGIFLKHSPPATLVDAIRLVHAGEVYLDPRSAYLLAEAATNARQELASPQLSAREIDVLRGVFEGFTNKEIGARLSLSETYVKALLQQLFAKTGVRSRGQLVRVVLEKKLYRDALEAGPRR